LRDRLSPFWTRLTFGYTIGAIVGIVSGAIDVVINGIFNQSLYGTVGPLDCPFFGALFGAIYGIIFGQNKGYTPGLIFLPTIWSIIGTIIGSYSTVAFEIGNGTIYGQIAGALLGMIIFVIRNSRNKSG
jgi:hypothetical protein